MPSTCEEPVTTSTTATTATTTTTTTQAVQSTAETLSLPKIDISLIGLFPVWAGYVVLVVFVLFLILFVFSFMYKNSVITEYWSKFLWGSLFILLVSLSAINGTFNSALATKNICNTAKDPTIKIILATLSAIALLMGYIIYFEFGNNIDVQTYILTMLHVNLFCSILVLTYVVMFKHANTSKTII